MRQGRVTEGASSNAWIVSRDGKLITHPLGRDILAGITRSVVIDVLKAQGLAFEERAFSVEEAYAAREAFITSASQIVLPVVTHRWPAGRQWRARPDRDGACAATTTVTPKLPDFRLSEAPKNSNYFSSLMAAYANLCLHRNTACHLIAAS